MSEKGRGRRGSWLGVGTAMLVFAAVGIMAMSSASGSVTTAGLLTRPYKSLSSSLFEFQGQNGCAKSKFTTAPSWSKSAGVFKAGMVSTLPACKQTATGNDGYSSGDLTLETLHPTFSSKTHRSVTVTWAMTYNASWTYSGFSSCTLNYSVSYSSCFVEGSVFTQVELWVQDETNSTWGPYSAGFAYSYWFSNNESEVSNYSSCYSCVTPSSGNTTYGVPGAFSGTIHGATTLALTGTSALNKHDTYLYEIEVDVQTDADESVTSATATGIPTGFASLNMATNGNGFVLQSVNFA